MDWLVAGLVAEAAFAAFAPALWGEFVAWDDTANFVDNLAYRGLGREQLRWMLTSLDAGWAPLAWVTLGLDYELWGMRPAGYHLTSLLLHALAAGAAYLVALRLLWAAAAPLPRVTPDPRTALRVSAAASALLWALHPLRVESVAWITERRDVLCGVFFLAAVWCYLRAVDGARVRTRWYWASVGAAALAVLSKASAVPLPAILITLDVYPLRRLGPGRPGARRVWLEKLPFVALSAGTALMAVLAQREIGALSGAALGVGQRLAISAYALVFYVGKTLVPVGLSPLYEMPFRLDPTAPLYLACGVIVVAVAAALWRLRRRWPSLAAAAAAFTLLLLPTLGLVHYGPHIAADRNTYLAGLAPALLAGGGVLRAWRARPALRRAAAGLALALVIVLAVLTWRQSGIWHDSETLWRHALRVSPSAIAHGQLGTVLDGAGRPAEALPHFEASVRLRPSLAVTYNNWALALGHLRRFDEAIPRFEMALRLRPDYDDARRNLEQTRALAAGRAARREAPPRGSP